MDAFYRAKNLVIEYHERQHTEHVAFFERITACGLGRGEQRRQYDKRRSDLLPAHGFQLVILDYKMFDVDFARPDSSRERQGYRASEMLLVEYLS